MHLNSVSLQVESYPADGEYPFNLPVFRQTRRITLERPVTLFAGENGTGKSTLLEAISRAAGIHIWREPQRDRVTRNRYEERLCDFLRLEWANGPVQGSFFGAGNFRHFALLLEEWAAADPALLEDFGGKSLMTQSQGQSFLAFFRNCYRVKGLHLLDEPETALSPRSQVRLMEILRDMASAGHAQFIVATHSPILLSCPGAMIYSFDAAPLRPIRYEDTEHYRVYRDFLNERPRAE